MSDFNVMLISLAVHGLFYTSAIACLDSRVIRRLCTKVALRLSPGFSAVDTANNVEAESGSARGWNHKGQDYVLDVENLTNVYFVSCRSKPRRGVKVIRFVANNLDHKTELFGKLSILKIVDAVELKYVIIVFIE